MAAAGEMSGIVEPIIIMSMANAACTMFSMSRWALIEKKKKLGTGEIAPYNGPFTVCYTTS